MPDTILQNFLNHQFISVNSDEDYVKLQKAVEELKKKWIKDKSKIVSASLVAIDPSISEETPIFKEVEQTIVSKWSTFVNNVSRTSEPPNNYYRGIILQVLQNLSSDNKIAAMILHTICNIVQYLPLGREQNIIEDYTNDIWNLVEKEAIKQWVVLQELEIRELPFAEIKLPEIKNVNIQQEELKSHLLAASARGGYGGDNPHPTSEWANWPNYFADRAAVGITKTIKSALDNQSKDTKIITASIQEELNSYMSGIKPYFEEIAQSLLQSSNALQLRSNLIWWKESAYSNMYKKSYRSLPPIESSIAMAIDLANSTPSLYPRSLDYLLKESLINVLGLEAQKKYEINEILAMITNSSISIKKDADNGNTQSTRIRMYDFLIMLINKDVTPEEFQTHVGVKLETKISLYELSIWIFHDLHSLKIEKTK